MLQLRRSIPLPAFWREDFKDSLFQLSLFYIRLLNCAERLFKSFLARPAAAGIASPKRVIFAG